MSLVLSIIVVTVISSGNAKLVKNAIFSNSHYLVNVYLDTLFPQVKVAKNANWDAKTVYSLLNPVVNALMGIT